MLFFYTAKLTLSNGMENSVHFWIKSVFIFKGLNTIKRKHSQLSQLTEQLHHSEIGDILENSLGGKRLDIDECRRLLESNDVHLMGLVAGYLTRKKFGRRSSFVNNMILNYTKNQMIKYL